MIYSGCIASSVSIHPLPGSCLALFNPSNKRGCYRTCRGPSDACCSCDTWGLLIKSYPAPFLQHNDQCISAAFHCLLEGGNFNNFAATFSLHLVHSLFVGFGLILEEDYELFYFHSFMGYGHRRLSQHLSAHF